MPDAQREAQRELRAAVQGTPLESRLERFAEPFFERRGADRSLRGLTAERARGLARLLASHPDCARYLAHRPELLERIAAADRAALDRRGAELEHMERPARDGDLEEFLDALRIFRRDETWLCAALDLGGEIRFERASQYLSAVAETALRWSLEEAADRVPGAQPAELAIVGMGKVSGRELTYHSDLDLVFLYADERAARPQPVAIAQRVISYLGTMTGAGIAYSVDARLRPSGRQGALVSVFSAFEAYQREKAATWEHLALMRARVLAGDPRAGAALRQTQRAVHGRHRAVWPEVAEMRERVVRERAQPGVLRESGDAAPYKTGTGGLMDVEFLAQAAVLECGSSAEAERLPSIENLLRSAARGPRADALLQRYRFLRLLEARNRWVCGRAVERFSSAGEGADCVAELVEPGAGLGALGARLEATRSEIRAAYQRVIESGSIAALR